MIRRMLLFVFFQFCLFGGLVRHSGLHMGLKRSRDMQSLFSHLHVCSAQLFRAELNFMELNFGFRVSLNPKPLNPKPLNLMISRQGDSTPMR